MKEYYLAVDIGASSGRHILGNMEDQCLEIEEMHRFDNELKKVNGHKCWDLPYLYEEILDGMKKCGAQGKIPLTMGIDTWAVDFVLLDQENRVIGDSVAYRDHRTEGMKEEVYQIISKDELYSRTGIQEQNFNTIFQLMAIKKEHPEYFKEAKTFMMVPDYLHFLLTGIKTNEYTNATTTQLVNATTKNWDMEIIDALGFPKNIFGSLIEPGTEIGPLLPEVAQKVGYSCLVVAPATHDTASAVVAVPAEQQDAIYISSGTWSLMGTELEKANTSKESQRHNFTNEGGYGYRYRFLRNIMGLWMIQSVRKEMQTPVSFAELCQGAEREKIMSVVDCNDSRFLAPDNMTEEICTYCAETGQEIPKSPYELAKIIYQSLAVSYGNGKTEIEKLTGRHYEELYIVGGGTNADYLNRLTAKQCRCNVYAGAGEATAIGNLMVQMLHQKIWKDIGEAKRCVGKSFPMKLYVWAEVPK